MIHRLFLFILFIACAGELSAQNPIQLDTSVFNSLRLIPADRSTLLKRMDIIFNIQYANTNNFTDGKYTGTAYALRQFRMEVIGEIFDSVFFRFRERYTRNPTPQSVDNTDLSVDMAFIDIRFSRKFYATFGKLTADYGGYEIETNPIYIYQYNDLNANFDGYEVGAGVGWKITPTEKVALQLLNARTQTFAEIYDSIPGITPSRFPALAVANWRGNFAGKRFNTCYSFSVVQEAKNRYV